ncbi:MAG: Thioredoxin-dependent 5'-adenylylsulfate reductase [Candidatus Ordinivivax streblomastigis]|uniref:Thioredoxin-dependent 5'-adenylylsulfate reductase n=1 Tax=Candidatus Ordinivivax streblomastigis TaxID=2540710 RepID=A0A5M8NT74_9BACT|nr:MAG: Thioredoxin-dependent 5'-adenylylsulfate reductase [Candidatus Ordinivivax streblomastigis]
MTYDELKYRQSWTLEQKIDHTAGVISSFSAKANGNIFASFSGGKDSTVMLDIIRRFVDKNIPAVFCNTGNEYPEVVKFVRQTENVTVIHPEIHIRQIIEKYGFPLISKEQSQYIRQAKHTNSEKLRNIRLHGSINGIGKIAERWKFLIEAPFNVSEKCCDFLKKKPFEKFRKKTGLHPVIGTMASESRLRFQKWLKHGCNSFETNLIASYPLSIWTEEDVWAYIRRFKIPYCSIYDMGIKRTGCMFCSFGCHIKGDRRFYFLKENKPKIYEHFMKMGNNGITYREALQYCGIDFPDSINKQMKLEF